MAETSLPSSLAVMHWTKTTVAEYFRESGFAAYMGAGATNIIQIKREFGTGRGKGINIALRGRMKGNGVTGSQVLEGNEEELGLYNCQIVVDWLRHAAVITDAEQYKTDINLLNEVRDAVRDWFADKLRASTIQALGSILAAGSVGSFDTAVNYASATTGQKDAFNVANVDRLLFGALKSNYSATHATALGNIDNTADKLTTGMISLAKRMAKVADPKITPYRTSSGREYFVLFAHPFAFRDLKADTAMIAANRDARAREGDGMDDNPIFQDGDLIWDGVIIREIPELTDLTIASTINVAQNFLCGRQAIGLVYGQRPTAIKQVNDYGFRTGAGLAELKGMQKMSWGGTGVQFGVFTVFTAAVADS
jgi:N4-gp56 family major capsid protein